MRTPIILAAALPLALLFGACDATEESKTTDEAKAAAAAELEPGKTAASFRLQAVVELVKGDTVADAKALEAKINDPEAELNAVDLDDDGETDFVEVVEVRSNGETTLEFRAIPSSKKDKPAKEVGVVIAELELELKDKEALVVHAVYTQHIDHDVEVHVYHHEEPIEYEHGALVVADGCFYHYVFVHEHEPYHGHHHYIVVEAPHVDVHIDHKHHKHKHHKHKGHKHKGHKKPKHYKGHW